MSRSSGSQSRTSLRPAAVKALEGPARLKLWVEVFPRFFAWVWVAVIILPIGGIGLTMAEEVQAAFVLGQTSPAFRSLVGTNNGIGTLTVNGNLSMSGTLAVELAGATTAGLAGEMDGGAHGVVGCDHLALLEVAAGAAFIAAGELALAHHVVHGLSAFDDDETVRLLNHQEQHGHG